ncbi:MAG: lysyl oxidase family protein [Polyangiales bacterium]
MARVALQAQAEPPGQAALAGEGDTGGAAGEGGAAGAAGEGGTGGLGGAAGMGGGAGTLPDLTATVSNIQMEFDTTVPAADLLEGCASASSGIDILRFSGTTHNLGPADVVIGDPGCPNCEQNPLAVCAHPNFICAPADGHGHYQNFAAYELLDETGQNVVAQGHKQGFCLRDSFCSFGSLTFDCDFQGLAAGCSDIYGYTLGCQYIEITGVPAGNYLVRMTSDPLNLFAETNETNNAHSVPVTIPPR